MNGLPEPETFSTSKIARDASLDAWRLYMKEVYFQLDIRARNEDAIAGQLARRRIATLGTSFLSADDQRVMRTKDSIVADSAECFCVVFITRGQFTYRQCGREASAAAGDVYLLNAQEAYEVDLAGHPEMLCLSVPADLLRARIRHVDDLCAKEHFADRTMSLALRSLVSGALSNDSLIEPVRLQDLCLSMTEMMLKPSGEPGERLAYSRQNASFVVARARNVMKELCSDPKLTVGQVAIACGVSTRQLQHVFQAADTTFVSELLSIRLKSAANLLRPIDKRRPRISDVSVACGFSSQSYFSTCFKRFHGYSPKDALTIDK